MDNEKINKGRYRLELKAKERDLTLPIFGLEKAPAEALLKLALEEIGEQEAYIEELEEKVNALEQDRQNAWKEEKKALVHEIKSEAFLQVQKEKYLSRYENKITKAHEQIRQLKKARNDLLQEVLALRERLQERSEGGGDKL